MVNQKPKKQKGRTSPVSLAGEGGPKTFSLQPGRERIQFTQSGGFTGIRKGCDVSLEDLPPRVRSGLSVLRRLKNRGREMSAARDSTLYHLRFQGATEESLVQWDELSLPSKARPLIAFLSSQSRPLSPESSHGA
ncbi:MAG: hypothetical protein JNK54_08325 [Elusimicrobia bacterium]|nr:hypothetical protein [Elusimicrobiota bacterium]